MTGPASGPLDGLRVLDFTQMLAGPYCTMVLADLAADVVKIEPPGGDLTRRLGPYLSGDDGSEYGGYFQSVNRNKRSVVLDLKSDAGRAAALALASDADVLVENFRPGVMARLGLGWPALHDANPRLVYASISGFGDPDLGESPYGGWPAFDLTAQAMGGLMGITGPADGPPMKAGPGVGDIFPGALATVGILAAVRVAERGGGGQRVDVGMVDSVLALCERIVYQLSYGGESPGPEGNEHPLLCPYGVFRCRDGWIVLTAPSEPHWRRLAELIGRPELATDERYSSNPARVAHRGAIDAAIEAWTTARTKSEIVAAVGGTIPVAPVLTAREIFEHPHFRAREMLVEVEQPGADRTVTIAGSPLKFSQTPAGVRRRAPTLGEHTAAVLAELARRPQRLGGAIA
jgi:crotonobetainyl-CoA:carnitine CoA-transferase CaiB-like acyl-CoA transferase